MLSRGWQYIQMQGKDVFKHAVKALEAVTWEAMDAVGWKTDALDMVFCHQANMRILDFVRERLGLSEDKLFINIHKYGNTSAASIPIALDEANRGGRLFAGANVLMMAFGGGFTWGSLAMRW
jgi:3-oxoacyl-[acyl-carrier-protein] synthase-3